MDRKTLEQNYQKSFGASPAAELEQNYQRSGIDSLVQSVKKATQYNPSAPSTQPTQAAPAGASSSKQSDVMKEQLDAIKKQRDDAAIKAGAYMRAGNMPQQAKEQQKIANKAAIEYENAYTQWKNQRNAEAVEDYNPDENKFKAGDAILSGVQNAFQSMRQHAAAASSYLSGNPEAQAWEAKRLMESGVSGTEAVKRAGLADKREIPITDYKTQAELRHEKNVASVGAVEGGALQLVNTISNMVPSLVANAVLPGSGLPVMAASVAGNKYADAYEKYGNTDTAFVLGSAAGGASMLTEQFGGLYGSLGKSAAGQAVAKKLMAEAPGLYNLANSVGGKWLRDALSEGIEEGAEDVINYAIEKALTGDSDEMDNFGYDMLLGALAGGVLGGGNAAMRSVTYSRVGKALNASPAAVAQQVQEGMEKGAGTAPAIYAAEVQKNPSNQMVGRLYEANLTYDAESGLSKIQNDITQVSINEIKAMVSKADALAQAAQKLNVEATPQAVATAITDAQRTQSIKTAEDSVGQAFAPTVDNPPVNAGEKAYNSALAGVAANQGVAARINNDPAARQAFSQLTGVQFSGNTAQDIAAIEVATQNIAKSGKQAISQAEYAQRVTAAGEQAAAQFDADMQAQAEQMQRESDERWLSVEQNTITDVDGKRRIKEITNTDVRGNTEIGYKKAEIPGSKKKAVAEVNNAAKYLGKTIVWFEGAVQVNGQYRLTNGYRAPDGTIYVNINSRDPLMVTFGHEMFHDLVADSKYSGMIDTLVENPDYADMVKGMMDAKTELYERNGIELDQNAAAEEVAADISGDLLGSRDMLEYIGARNTEAATGIKGFLNRILKKLKGKPSAQEAYNRLSEAQKALLDGMEGKAETGVNTLHLVDNATKKAVVSQRPQTLGSSEPITASEMGSNSFSADMVPQSDTAVNNYSMQNSAEDASGKHSLMDIPAMDSEYSAAVESGNMQEAQRLVDEAAKENGYTIKAFHGTSRGDRVGNVFLPERATSGPMAFFTDNREVAERYSRDKADTSLAYDPDFDQYETQFRIKAGKLDVPLIKAWGYLPFDARNRITKKAGQVRMDMDTGDIIVDQSTNEANGGFQWQIKEFKGNTLAALNEQWLNSGTLFNEEGTYLDVLKAAGVFDEFAKVKGMGEPYFKDPKYREEKVYDVFLGIRNPFDVVQDVNNEFIDAFEEWYTEQDQSVYDRETADADMWDKNSITAEEFADRMREDVANGTTMSWTSIPDSMTDYLKSLGYDGIKDVGGKYSGSDHTVWIPFSSEQVKSAEPIVYDDAGNVIPLSERFNNSNKDIRYSLMEDAQYMADIDKAVSEATQKADDELKAAQAQVKDLRKQLLEMRNRAEYAELQTKVTEKPTIDPIKAKKDIGRFLRKNGITSEETIKTLTAEIEDAFNSVYRWEKTDIDAAAKKAADAILKEATVADPLKTEKADIRKSLSQRTFVIGEQLRGDIVRKYGSLTNFRKKYGNIIRIKTRENAKAGEGVAFDVAYPELQSEFPGIFRDAVTEWETFANTVEAADYAMRSDPVMLADMLDSQEFADSVSNQLAEILWNQKNLVTEADKAKARADAATEKAVSAAVEAERRRAEKETAANDRWREAETKLLADMAAAKEREKAAKARAEFMQKYDSLSKQYRADLRANNQQAQEKYNEKLSEAKDEFNRRRTQDRIDRVVREDRAKSKARLRTAEQKSTTTEDVAKVLTEMPKKDKETFKAKAAKDWRTFKRQWINTKDELERFGNEVGDSRIMYAANNVGQASAAAQYSIGGAGQYDLNGKKIGDKNLMQVFEPAKKAGLTDEFYTYLLHEHNVDRMSVRENAQRQLAELRAKLNREVNGFAEMTDENIATAAGKDTTLTKAYTEAQIAAAKQYKQFQAWAEKQFDKPVFGSSVTADDSRAAAADLLDAHPEFEKWAKDVYAYLDGLMEVRKQGGLVSADMAQYMKELYPHYVPTYRDMPSTSGGYSNPNSVAVNSTIKSAKGGNQDIMPLIDSIARQTLQTFSAAKKNILGNMLYEDAMDTTRDISEYIQSVTEEGDLVDLDADSAENLKNTLRIWVDGKPVTLHMSEAMADGFRPIEQSNSFGMKALRSINSTFKKLVTQWNPVFIVRNFVRDAQSALYFTHYSNATFIKNYGKAVKEIATNGKYWQLYQAMGGKGTTYYDPKTGLSDRHHFKNGAVDKVAGGLNRVIDILSFANEAVEQYPRLAEFISTMEDTGDVQQALYNAADITTNFGRGGFAARKLNASLVPFFNPGMQGLSKNIRNVIDRRGWKEIGQLISRLLINGVAPGIIMGLLYDGLKEDDDYKELSNYIKDSNILIKIGDNKFIKVPMGREPSVITAFTNRMWRWLKGEPASSAFAGYPSFAIEQIAPNNPLTNNIFAGITAMSTNKTWYGGDIVSSYMEEKPDYLQYDESTDAFSIWLGEITRHGKNGIEGLSPKKVNYLIDQYSGFIGDWLLPTLSKKADVPAVVKAFVVDSVRQNRLGSDFYDALDEAKQVKETELATAADDATYSYLYKQSKAASEITKQLKEIYNSGEKTRKEKREEARDLLELRNEIYRKALLTVGAYEETAKSIGSADSDVVKREANRKAFGAEYALKTYNKDVGEKAAEYVAQGVTYDQYYAAYFAARGITGDKDENGKTITNSASRKKKEAIDKAVPGASTKQKHLLYEALGVSEKVW
nr:MAG TPA: Large polyvalent protein associated domain 38 [Caudoviricetes sp.]